MRELAWLFAPRPRDLFLILTGTVGLLVSCYFAGRSLYTASLDHRAQIESARQAEVQRWEEDTRTQLKQQGGVRGSELGSPAAANSSAPGTHLLQPPEGHPQGLTLVSVDVRSDPPGADVFLNWERKGRTPLRLEGENIGGLLLVMKDHHQAWFRQVKYRNSDTLDVPLPVEQPRSHTRLLLVISDPSHREAVSLLSARFAEEGFTMLSFPEGEEFQRTASAAHDPSQSEFRAWARARFDTDLLATVLFDQSSRELSEQRFADPGVREAIGGTVRAEAHLTVAVTDLRSGVSIATVSGEGVGFALDRAQGLQKAFTQAVTDVAGKLRRQILG